MKFQKTSAGAAGPSSALGIMRFFDTDAGGPKMSPEFVVIAAVLLAVVVLIVGKFLFPA
ncbi:MAG: preprotein translocase subunit Sec61beta [Candidatus Diapherotrites archaeon]